MKAEKKLRLWTRLIVTSLLLVIVANARAQEKLNLSYAALGGANSIWNIGEKNKCTKKSGCDFRIFDPTIENRKSKSGPADENGWGVLHSF